MVENLIIINKINGYRAFVFNPTDTTISQRTVDMEELLLSIGGHARITIESLSEEEWKEIRGKRSCPKCEAKKKGVAP